MDIRISSYLKKDGKNPVPTESDFYILFSASLLSLISTQVHLS